MTMTADMEETVNSAAARLADINARITDLKQQADALKSFIRLALGPGSHTAGDLRVTISPRRVFDPVLAAKVIPDDLMPLVLVVERRIDPAKARELLPPDILAACLRETEPQVRLT